MMFIMFTPCLDEHISEVNTPSSSVRQHFLRLRIVRKVQSTNLRLGPRKNMRVYVCSCMVSS